MDDSDRCLIESVAEQSLRLAHMVPGGNQIGEVGDRTHPAWNTVGGDHPFRVMADRVVVGLCAIVELNRARPSAEISPRTFHVLAVAGMHALRPGIWAVPRFESEYAAVLRIAVSHVAGRI